jgi:hypothetical protein
MSQRNLQQASEPAEIYGSEGARITGRSGPGVCGPSRRTVRAGLGRNVWTGSYRRVRLFTRAAHDDFPSSQRLD